MTNRLVKNLIRAVLVISFILLTTSAVYADFGDTVLKKGMSSSDVVTLQESLHKLGYFEDDSYTDYYGEATEAAVIKFQKDLDGKVKADGIAGKDTLKYLKIKMKQLTLLPDKFDTLSPGDTGSKVSEIQTKLKSLDMYSGDINASYDAETKSAVVKFQKEVGLSATGTVDKETYLKLNVASDKSYGSRAGARRRITNMSLVEFAKKQLGKPYVWGASSGKGFDCSGLVIYIFNRFNVALEHSAAAQFNKGTKVEKDKLEPGDLVFFTTYKKGPSHVGIYIGNNKFIHASSGVDKVTINDLDMSYYKSRYLGARRYNLISKN